MKNNEVILIEICDKTLYVSVFQSNNVIDFTKCNHYCKGKLPVVYSVDFC